jgi:hypothetical protein
MSRPYKRLAYTGALLVLLSILTPGLWVYPTGLFLSLQQSASIYFIENGSPTNSLPNRWRGVPDWIFLHLWPAPRLRDYWLSLHIRHGQIRHRRGDLPPRRSPNIAL